MTNPDSDLATYRVLDAAINRASEGIRVVEDFTRMVVNDRYLSTCLKQMRHQLTSVVESLDHQKRISARDSQTDVGRTITTETEYLRESTSGVVQANMSRASQALRTIEEFSKTIDGRIAAKIEQLRYESYTLEKAILTTMMSQKSLAETRLYVLLDSLGDLEKLQQTARALVDAGVDMIQLRDKSLPDREKIMAGKAIGEALKGTAAKWIMNDRCDLAVAAGAHGVHLGQDDLRVSDARRVVGPSVLVGVSTHNIEQARKAVVDGANYIGVGPVFPSSTKSFDQFVTVDLVEQVCAEIQLPAFAIGGINLENLNQVTQVGCQRIAVSGVVMNDGDPAIAASKLKSELVESA